MKIFIYCVLLSFSSLALPTQLLAAVGDVNYISDVLTVPLRSGASTKHRILHQGLPSGTKLTILATDEEAGFTQVRTSNGMEGWLRSQYLTGEPIARDKLADAKKRLQDLKAKIDKERKARSSLESESKVLAASNQTLDSKVQALSQELAELKVISADPINEHARNVELAKQNERLAGEVDELSQKIRQLENNVQREWLLYGGGLTLIGLLLGVAIKARPRQTSYSRYG